MCPRELSGWGLNPAGVAGLQNLADHEALTTHRPKGDKVVPERNEKSWEGTMIYRWEMQNRT